MCNQPFVVAILLNRVAIEPFLGTYVGRYVNKSTYQLKVSVSHSRALTELLINVKYTLQMVSKGYI